jgi:hypothetical protein
MNGLDLVSSDGKIPDILEYNQKDYQERYSSAFITGFNHGSMAKGPVDINHVRKLVTTLNEKVVKVTQAISFNEATIESPLAGGSCSSIAFRIGCAALKFFEKSKNDSEGLIKCIKAVVEEINALSPSGRKEVRGVQAAFNTIHVDTAVKVKDICQNKIKALAALFDISISQSTDELVVQDSENCLKAFNKMVSNLSVGVYFVRILEKNDNHKLETQGHSTIYIKDEQGMELYFDTQLGLYDIGQARDFIYMSICSALKRFAVNVCKFHQLA